MGKFIMCIICMNHNEYFTLFEPCIVIQLCNKNQKNAHFFTNDLI